MALPAGRFRLALFSVLASILVMACVRRPTSGPVTDLIPQAVRTAIPDLRAGGAAEAKILAVGTKADDNFRRARLLHIAVQTEAIGGVATQIADTTKLKAAGIAPTRLAARLDAGEAATAQYRLVFTMVTDPSVVRDSLNAVLQRDPSLLNDLRGDTRLVDVVGLAYAFSAAEVARLGGGVNAQVRRDSLVFEAGTSRQTALKLDDGMVVAYRLALICWSPDGRTVSRIVRDAPDRGTNGSCE
ncbi:MAG TPA: hypothetical protein VIP11_12635 [Gemmatimonadaceae bacterium]